MSHIKADNPLPGVYIEPALYGGFTVESAPNHRGEIRLIFAAFSTRDEALSWVKENICESIKKANNT